MLTLLALHVTQPSYAYPIPLGRVGELERRSRVALGLYIEWMFMMDIG